MSLFTLHIMDMQKHKQIKLSFCSYLRLTKSKLNDWQNRKNDRIWLVLDGRFGRSREDWPLLHHFTRFSGPVLAPLYSFLAAYKIFSLSRPTSSIQKTNLNCDFNITLPSSLLFTMSRRTENWSSPTDESITSNLTTMSPSSPKPAADDSGISRYYSGLPGNPKLLARSSNDPVPVQRDETFPMYKQLSNVGSHKIVQLFDSGVREDIRRILHNHEYHGSQSM
jgi:hypothetical protein